MKDLYETLGVPRDADQTTIKRAYRARAKKAHPDAGGSPEQFGELTLAYDVLRDEQRREKYDRTGEAEAGTVDNKHVAILQRVTQALEYAMERAIEMDANNPLSKNILSIAKADIEAQLQYLQKGKRQADRNAKLSRRAAGKFTAKNGENHIAGIFSAKATNFEAAVKSAEATEKLLRQALDFLANYNFSRDPGTDDRQAAFMTFTASHSL